MGMYLQTLARMDLVDGHHLPPHVSVADVTDIMGLCDKLSDTFKYIVMSGNHQMTMTMLELYDIIIGYEVEEDFTQDNREHIRKLSRTVLAWVQKKLPGYGGALDINNEKS